VRSGESDKRRPAVIVSNERAKATAARLGRGVVTSLDVDSQAQAEQVRSVAVERLGPVLGHVPAGIMEEVDTALRLHLQL